MPFRPVVDLLVVRLLTPEDTLEAQHRRTLFNCLNLDVLSGQHHSLSYAVEREVQSLGRSFEAKEARLLLPKLLESAQHEYEQIYADARVF